MDAAAPLPQRAMPEAPAAPSPSSPPCVLGKGISHPGVGAGLRSQLLSPRKQLGTAAALEPA